MLSAAFDLEDVDQVAGYSIQVYQRHGASVGVRDLGVDLRVVHRQHLAPAVGHVEVTQAAVGTSVGCLVGLVHHHQIVRSRGHRPFAPPGVGVADVGQQLAASGEEQQTQAVVVDVSVAWRPGHVYLHLVVARAPAENAVAQGW